MDDAMYLALAVAGWFLVVGFAAGCARLEGARMNGMVILGGLVSAGLLVYLVAALLQPENFS